LPRLVGFLLWYAKELFVSNAAVMYDVLTIEHKSSPIVVRHPTRCRNEFETALLSVLISLTPGTLALATVAPRTGGSGADTGYELYVHCMYDDDPDSARRGLQRLEQRMLRGIRPEGDPR
jgi:multicomponent Na+:H+ antiporter subunit E